ncbi:MAG: hypothetical protein ACQ9MH_21440 [Nitrospinales bacterium]
MQHAQYIRLCTDESGESHFEDLENELAPMDFAPPAAPLNIAQFLPTAQSLWVGAPVGWQEKSHIQALDVRYFVQYRANMK